ncbi:OmpA family protein [Spirosoma luteum]|uniref:OmpA family protein n=1 Tax=Spirosoma luteum TaxID=431553 RepID=UPI0003825A24|nr:OmpA family protein [Spirosoma luteum]
MTNGLTSQSIDRHRLVVLFFTWYCLFFIYNTGIGNSDLPNERSVFNQGTIPVFVGDSAQKTKPSTLVIKVFANNITTPLTSATAVITSTLTGKVERFALPTGQIYCTFTKADQLSIDISAPGYTSVNRKMTIPVSPQGNRYEFDAELDRVKISLTILAVDRQTSLVIPGVHFTISGINTGNKSIKLVPDSTTGLVRVELPGKGIYSLSCAANGYDDFAKSIKLDSAQNEARVILTAKRMPVGVKPEVREAIVREAPVISSPAKKPVSAPIATNAASAPVAAAKPVALLEKGRPIALPNIYFDQSSPVLRPESYTELNQLADVLKTNPGLIIEIRGHTDNQGDFDLNVKLSRDRCLAIVDYLVNKGIAKNHLKAVGRGPIDPVAPNNNEENRKKNRRVEFLVL